MNKEPVPLTQAQIQVLYTRGVIDQQTWSRAVRALRGDPSHEGKHAIQTCAVAIEALVERALNGACAVIQEKLGVKTGDLAAAVLSDGTIERELTRYVHAELAMAGNDSSLEVVRDSSLEVVRDSSLEVVRDSSLEVVGGSDNGGGEDGP